MLINLSCDVHELSSPEYLKVEGKIDFEVTEFHLSSDTSAPPEIYLTLRTEKIYPCVNYLIKTNLDDSKTDLIDVDLLGIQTPEICLTALGPATTSLKLKVGEGDYNLRIHSKNFNVIYKLKIDSKAIIILGDETLNVKPVTNIFWRFPEKSFVYLCGTTVSDKYTCDNFLDTLRSKIALTEFHFPAGGKLPYPTSSSGYYLNMPARYFYYKNEEDFERAGKIMKNYYSKYLKNKQGIGLSISNWMGKFYYSWMM